MTVRRRRTVPATELRVHLGAALRALADEDLVIEKGGIPVALLTRYSPAVVSATELETEYARSLSKVAGPGGWERMSAAMAAGWAGVSAEEMVANLYRWRAEGGVSPRPSLDDDEAGEDDDDGEVPAGQRYLYQRRPKTQRVAEGPRPEYKV
ncbi:MAG TPA: hypothetical protein VEZ14_03995 [Dehalococcoidia bacterium]|nr:hypothetical protein [Dehalococcoidia bacterium]